MTCKGQLWQIVLAGLICLAVCVSAAGRSEAFPGEPEGFGGLIWGTPKEAAGSMRYVGTESGDILLYERSNDGDELYFGQARLIAVQYGFKDGRLATVTLRVNSLLQYLLMKEEAVRRYGKGQEMAERKDSYAWNGEHTQILLVADFTES